MGERQHSELCAGLASLWQTREFADLIIYGRECSQQPVHRAIVCPRSELLHNAVKVGEWKDGIEGQILLDDEDDVVRLLLQYLYLLDYEPLTGLPEGIGPVGGESNGSSGTLSPHTDAGQYGHVYGTSAVSAFGGPSSPLHFCSRTDSNLTMHAMPTATAEFSNLTNKQSRLPQLPRGMVTNSPGPSSLATKEPNLVLHARVYAAAEKYGVHALKALSLDKFKIQLTQHWDSKELAQALHVVFSSTPPLDKDMREAIADTLGWHGRLLEKPEIEVAILEIDGLAYELLKRSRRVSSRYMK